MRGPRGRPRVGLALLGPPYAGYAGSVPLNRWLPDGGSEVAPAAPRVVTRTRVATARVTPAQVSTATAGVVGPAEAAPAAGIVAEIPAAGVAATPAEVAPASRGVVTAAEVPSTAGIAAEIPAPAHVFQAGGFARADPG